ncbi:hypothetical protein [Pimelobacter sp. 30-1]|uniref:hypothetical protein n=1 Tax=Pimelobacter sp. 30-1 TaxID=2004991 RepID=UPI001C05A03D|nr:hypothetical protein [Pimelobacter sp. 30-1]MBU2693854.1 hypothetical protein [Pimelobacter sp. 30-1]
MPAPPDPGTSCLHCAAETTNGLALCDLCQVRAATALEFVPVYFRNLARWRPGRAGVKQVPGSRVLWDGAHHDRSGDRVGRALGEAGSDLTTWARALADDRNLPLPTADDEPAVVAVTCRLLAQHLASIGTLEWAGAFVRQLATHEELLRRLTEDVAPGWYAGSCRSEVDGALCGADTYVVPGLTWVTCRGCGITTYARDHLATILEEARGWVARPKELAEVLVALHDSETSVPRLYDRIRKWSARGRIQAVRRLDDDGDQVGPKRYRLGEVLDLLAAESRPCAKGVSVRRARAVP